MTYHYLKEFFAESREAAVQAAAAHYGVDASELEVAEAASAGEVDLGGRQVFLIKIVGGAEEPPEISMQRRDDRRGDRRDGGRDRGRGRDRDRDRDRGRGRGRGDRRDGGRDRDRDRGRGRGPRKPRGDKPEGVDHERLEALAKAAADRVKASGDAEALEPMNSKERWVIHNFIKNVAGVTSESEGEGDEKRVRVRPE